MHLKEYFEEEHLYYILPNRLFFLAPKKVTPKENVNGTISKTYSSQKELENISSYWHSREAPLLDRFLLAIVVPSCLIGAKQWRW
jgi:hypothetical protein